MKHAWVVCLYYNSPNTILLNTRGKADKPVPGNRKFRNAPARLAAEPQCMIAVELATVPLACQRRTRAQRLQLRRRDVARKRGHAAIGAGAEAFLVDEG